MSSSSSVIVAEGRRVAADDVDAGQAPAQVQGELRERALVAAAVQPDAMAALGAALAVAEHQLRSVDAPLEAAPSRFAAHTTGMPSGSTSVAPRKTAAISGSSSALVSECTETAQT